MHIKFTGGIPDQKAFRLRCENGKEINVYWGKDGKPKLPDNWCDSNLKPKQKAFTLERKDGKKIDVYYDKDGNPEIPEDWCEGQNAYIHTVWNQDDN